MLISGLPGSGKSTLARAYVVDFGAVHINSDLVRDELGLRGRYDPNEKEKVYAAMLEKTKAALIEGRDVVVDSTFFQKKIRAPFERVAEKLGVRVYRIEVRAEEGTIRRRLQSTRPDSEADFAVYEKIRDQYEPWAQPHLTLWSDSATLEELVKRLREYCTSDDDN